MTSNYYTAPSQEIFDDIKRASLEIWSDYDDTYGYASEKIRRVERIGNVQDNAWYMVAMFDPTNQMKLLAKLNDESRSAVIDVLSHSRDV